MRVLVLLIGVELFGVFGLERLAVERTAAFNESTIGASLQQRPRTVWEGIYTIEQARRGESVYYRECGHCHRDDSNGGDAGEPPLVGPDFFIRWSNTSVAEMFLTVRRTMPHTAPGSLKPEEYVDVLSFLFKLNELPAGKMELPAEVEKLERILITDTPPKP